MGLIGVTIEVSRVSRLKEYITANRDEYIIPVTIEVSRVSRLKDGFVKQVVADDQVLQ